MRKWIFGFFGLTAIILGLIVVFLWVSLTSAPRRQAENLAAFRRDFTLNSVQYTVKLRLSNDLFRVQIRKLSDNSVQFESSADASSAMRWFLFEKHGNVWFYSGDIGTFAFLRSDNGGWTEHVWSPGSAVFQSTPMPRAFYDELPDSDKASSKPYLESP